MLYMETTIPSYLFGVPSRDTVAKGRQETTRAWWRRDHTRFTVFVSDAVLDEAKRGDPVAAGKRIEFLGQFSMLPSTPEVLLVTDLYLKKHIVPATNPDDAIHLAFASVYRIQFLCTWNFKHLANAFVLQELRNLNEKQGWFTPQVCTPEELLGE